ncbi:MAG: GNAT family N-acetyltransferase [Pseudomonadota bacterium]
MTNDTEEQEEDIPAGKIPSVVTRLAMTGNRVRTFPPPMAKVAVMVAEEPTCSFYRYLYNTVGEPWLWYERRQWSDEKLLDWLTDPSVTLYVLYHAGVPAGFAEIKQSKRYKGIPKDFAGKRIALLAYFGLLPDFIGRGLGTFFLSHVVRTVWADDLDGMVVDTCNWDHPKAFITYQRAGFEPVAQQRVLVDDPRLDGTLPPHAGPHIPPTP